MLRSWLCRDCLLQKISERVQSTEKHLIKQATSKYRSPAMLMCISYFLFILLGGCCNEQHNIPKEMLVLKSIALISLQDNVTEGRTFQIRSVANIDIVDENISLDSGIYKYRLEAKGEFGESISAECRYLGRQKGRHVIFRRYSTGGTGSFSDIVFCSTDGNALRIDRIILSGDRSDNGILNCSLTKNGRIFVEMYLSVQTLARISGVNGNIGNEPFQAYAEYWNISRCEYDLTDDKLRLIAISIMPNKRESDVVRILKNVIPNFGDHQVDIEQNDVSDFLRDFKSAYLLFCFRQ